jgi:adenosylcobinamide-GDP ribazoletransferase
LADFSDGFGSGASLERVLAIMKDSRVGSFAVITLILTFALKITTWSALLETTWWAGLAAIVWAQVLSRWSVVTIIFRLPYARNDASSKMRPISQALSWPGLLAATVWLLPGVGWALWHPWWLLSLPVAWIGRLILAAWFRRRLGGYTGDCLGAAQQITELMIALTLLALAQKGL